MKLNIINVFIFYEIHTYYNNMYLMSLKFNLVILIVVQCKIQYKIYKLLYKLYIHIVSKI